MEAEYKKAKVEDRRKGENMVAEGNLAALFKNRITES